MGFIKVFYVSEYLSFYNSSDLPNWLYFALPPYFCMSLSIMHVMKTSKFLCGVRMLLGTMEE